LKRHRIVKQQILEFEHKQIKVLDKALAEGRHAMARVIGIGVETADRLV
jgi:hypothetical protein